MEDFFFIKQNEINEDLLHEATRSHEAIIKVIWQFRLEKESTIELVDLDEMDTK